VFSFAVIPGCGGQSVRHTSDAEAGEGGSSGTGGSSFGGTSGTGVVTGGVSGTGAAPVGGTSGTAGSASCIYNNRLYTLGMSFADVDGCNTCTCVEGGVVACTLLECRLDCDWNGVFYAHGATFPEPDGCGTCRCAYRQITCMSMPCPPTRCDMLSFWYAERVTFVAKQCNPAIDIRQCTYLVNSSLPCGCQTWVNDADELNAWRNEWESLGCRSEIPCVPCPLPAQAGVCSLDGMCVDVP
jgi:hypothetical protein